MAAVVSPDLVTSNAVRSHIDASFEMESDDSSTESVGETTPFRGRAIELTRVRKQGSVVSSAPSALTATSTPEGKGGSGVLATELDTPSSEPFTVMFRIKSNDQLFRVASDTGGSIELGPDFEPINVAGASASSGRKLQTWQIVALSMFWWGFALWMYMFVVLMIPGQVSLSCVVSGSWCEHIPLRPPQPALACTPPTRRCPPSRPLTSTRIFTSYH
jgi:hypothetical protein